MFSTLPLNHPAPSAVSWAPGSAVWVECLFQTFTVSKQINELITVVNSAVEEKEAPYSLWCIAINAL